jgi:hypothetical protein
MSQRWSNYARVAFDRYETPAPVTESLIPHLPAGCSIWEPACGSGAMVATLTGAGYSVIASDIAGGRSEGHSSARRRRH